MKTLFIFQIPHIFNIITYNRDTIHLSVSVGEGEDCCDFARKQNENLSQGKYNTPSVCLLFTLMSCHLTLRPYIQQWRKLANHVTFGDSSLDFHFMRLYTFTFTTFQWLMLCVTLSCIQLQLVTFDI